MMRFIKSLFSRKRWAKGYSPFTATELKLGFVVSTTLGPDVNCWTTHVWDFHGKMVAWRVTHSHDDAFKAHKWHRDDLCPQLVEWQREEPLPVFCSADIIEGCYA